MPEAAVPPPTQQHVAIIGASIGGLSAATVLLQLGYLVDVYERSSSTFERRGSGLGFVDVALWEDLTGRPMLRRGTRATRQQGAFYYGDLWKYLYDGLPQGTVRLGHTVQSLGDDSSRPVVNGQAYDLVIVADGGWSGLRRYVTTSQPSYAGYNVFRGMLPASEVPWFSAFGVHKNGHFDTIVMPQTCDDGRDNIVCGCFIATPEAEVIKPSVGAARHGTEDGKERHNASIPDWFLPLYKQTFGSHQGGQLARLYEAVVSKGELKQHPQYEYRADRVTAGRVVLVGDAAHMASPRTAVGAHTAVLDAVGIREAFLAVEPGDIEAALRIYAPDGTERARQLWRRTREVSRDFLPQGDIANVVSPATLLTHG